MSIHPSGPHLRRDIDRFNQLLASAMPVSRRFALLPRDMAVALDKMATSTIFERLVTLDSRAGAQQARIEILTSISFQVADQSPHLLFVE
jgi:hypothetical protein